MSTKAMEKDERGRARPGTRAPANLPPGIPEHEDNENEREGRPGPANLPRTSHEPPTSRLPQPPAETGPPPTETLNTFGPSPLFVCAEAVTSSAASVHDRKGHENPTNDLCTDRAAESLPHAGGAAPRDGTAGQAERRPLPRGPRIADRAEGPLLHPGTSRGRPARARRRAETHQLDGESGVRPRGLSQRSAEARETVSQRWQDPGRDRAGSRFGSTQGGESGKLGIQPGKQAVRDRVLRRCGR